MLKAVIFDLYETLVTQSGVNVPRAGALGDALGLDATTYRKNGKTAAFVLRGELTFSEALMNAGAALGVQIPSDRVGRACADRVRANTIVFANADSELIAVTRDLSRRGFRLATISNCMAEDVVAWPGCAFAPHFERAVFSFAAGAVKPNPQIYLETVRQLGVNPADALYIGDGGDDELAGAERAGLRAAQAGWFVSRPGTEAVPLLERPRDILRIATAP